EVTMNLLEIKNQLYDLYKAKDDVSEIDAQIAKAEAVIGTKETQNVKERFEEWKKGKQGLK
ncbi:MAG: hypothetical protein FWG45_08085, partial [Oscillospiraceae bacterium]|nr:hypothetical protein [Oscillospiraceae bacterium]